MDFHQASPHSHQSLLRRREPRHGSNGTARHYSRRNKSPSQQLPARGMPSGLKLGSGCESTTLPRPLARQFASSMVRFCHTRKSPKTRKARVRQRKGQPWVIASAGRNHVYCQNNLLMRSCGAATRICYASLCPSALSVPLQQISLENISGLHGSATSYQKLSIGMNALMAWRRLSGQRPGSTKLRTSFAKIATKPG